MQLCVLQIEPKATDFIPAMIETISKIIDNGHAYTLPEGDVYFDVASLPGYGRLSGRSQVCVWAGGGREVPPHTVC